MDHKKMSLQKLALKDLAKKTLCDGHLFLISKEGRRFYVMQPGMLLDEEFIKKHALHNAAFEFEPIVKEEIIENFSKLLRQLKYLQFEKDLRLKSVELVMYFHTVFQRDEHFLNFALACYREFNLIPMERQKRMHGLDINLFRKSLYSAAFSIITALTSDFYHYTMLRDFFNLTFSLDMGLCDANYSYYVAKGCNRENQQPGTGAAWMKEEKASDAEIEVFLKHPQKSYEFVKSLSILSYPELSEITRFQHELSNGKGFPRGITKGQISSWEAVVLFADSLVEIEDSFSFEKNVVQHLLNFHNSKLNELPVGRVHNKICKAFEYFDSLKETGT